MTQVPVYRGKSAVSNVFSSQGILKEPELTGYLAYLLANEPEYLRGLFLQSKDILESVSIEESHEENRYDFILNTDKRLIVVEAKLGTTQHLNQLLRYAKKLKRDSRKPVKLVLLDEGSFFSDLDKTRLKKSLPHSIQVDFVTWAQIHKALKRLAHSKRKPESPRFFADELIRYLEENNMTSDEQKEVYCRELSGESIELYLKYRLYKSQPKFLNSARGCRYFAPYFTRTALTYFTEKGLPIAQGISFISPIEDMQVLERKEIVKYLKDKKHPNPKAAAKELVKQTNQKEPLVIRLGAPFNVFTTPITKKKMGVHGALGSRNYTFKKLFELSSSGE
jgi:hypothetical protein